MDDNQPVNINLINKITKVVEQPTSSYSIEDINPPVQTASRINNLSSKEQHDFRNKQHYTEPGIQQRDCIRTLINW